MNVQREHRRAFLSQMRAATNEDERRRADDRIRNEFEPRYLNTAETLLLELEMEAIKQMSDELGIPRAELGIGISERVKNQASNIGLETFNRAHGRFREQLSGEVDTPDGDNRVIKLLVAGTLAGIAAKAVSTAYNQGREEVIDLVVNVTGGEAMATRTAIMDSNTCGPCRDRDGKRYKYDSDAYHSNKPPTHCDGLGRCRCIYIYSIPIDVDLS